MSITLPLVGHTCVRLLFVFVQSHGAIYEATGGRRKCMFCRTPTKIRIVIAICTLDIINIIMSIIMSILFSGGENGRS